MAARQFAFIAGHQASRLRADFIIFKIASGVANAAILHPGSFYPNVISI